MQTAPTKAPAGCATPAPTTAPPQPKQLRLMASKCWIHTFLQHLQTNAIASGINVCSHLFPCHSRLNLGWRGWVSPACAAGLRLCGHPSPLTPSLRAVPGRGRASPTEWRLWVCASSRYRPCLWSSSILEEGRDQSGMTAHSRYLGHTHKSTKRDSWFGNITGTQIIHRKAQNINFSSDTYWNTFTADWYYSACPLTAISLCRQLCKALSLLSNTPIRIFK